MKMGYDSFECLKCYGYGSNNPCEDDGSHVETCLKCIHKICEATTNRVVYALKEKFDWNSNGRCTQCDTVGITIEILLCDYHSNQRPYLDDPNVEYDCYLCDYEGECHYDDEDSVTQELVCCDECQNELNTRFTVRTRGTPRIWEGNGYQDTCSRCNLERPVEELPLCNHHIELIK